MPSKTVATTIIKQLGSLGKLKAMVNARNFLAYDDGLSFMFSGSRKVNACKITLTRDLYTFELFKCGVKIGIKDVYKIEGLYFDMLIPTFESETGLYLSL